MTESDVLQQIVAHAIARPLSAAESEAAFNEVMQGNASPALASALLVALRTRGESSAEIAGGVRALQSAMHFVDLGATESLLDTCGTGGGRINTFNISTAAAFVAAGAGVRIAKHGNRSFTSRSGSADVLSALGVEIDLTPAGMQSVFSDAGIVFMFAPLLHPAIRHIAPIRKALGVPTIMNVLGPLTNPARAKLQVVGVSDPALLEIVAGALLELGHVRALVVHGAPGMDEISPLGETDIIELKNGGLERYVFDPAVELGWEPWGHEDLAGGEPTDNARIITMILAGERTGAARAAVSLNAGAAIYLAGLADSISNGVRVAEAAIDDGKGTESLERLRHASAGAERRTTP
ncbi:MAG: anthranilate phosphoribosyltransferase [Longimicrobiales bacterium]